MLTPSEEVGAYATVLRVQPNLADSLVSQVLACHEGQGKASHQKKGPP